MELAALLRLPAGLHLLNGTVLEAAVGVEVCSQRLSSPCPRWSCLSERVHSSDTRTLVDVPCAGRPLRITLRVRTFRCRDRRCPQHVLTER
jgi:hypothetical protein